MTPAQSDMLVQLGLTDYEHEEGWSYVHCFISDKVVIKINSSGDIYYHEYCLEKAKKITFNEALKVIKLKHYL